MKNTDTLIEILLSYSWQENLNTWIFKDKVLFIKQFTQPDLITSIAYAIERGIEDKFFLKTTNPTFGSFTIKVNADNPLPKIILESLTSAYIFYELHAFNSFSKEQRFIVEQRVQKLKVRFESKIEELKGRMFHLSKTARADKKILIDEYDSSIRQTQTKIEMIEMVIRSTINVAVNFNHYFENLEADIEKIEKEINDL